MLSVTDAQRSSCARTVWIDYAKAIGIFFVIWGHVWSDVSSSLGATDVIYRFIYAFHMPLFFLLSGIAFGYKMPKKREFAFGAELKKLAHRLLAPYAFWCMAWLFENFVGSIVKGRNLFSFLSMRFYMALTGCMMPMWFLYTLFMVEAAFLMIWKAFKNRDEEMLISKWGGVAAGSGGCCSRFGWRVQILST